MKDYVALRPEEVGLLNDALRSIELSLLCYLTRDPSWERFVQSVQEEEQSVVREAVVVLRRLLDRRPGKRATRPHWLWLAMLKRGCFLLTGWYPGAYWVSRETLMATGDYLEQYLQWAGSTLPIASETLARFRLAVGEAHAEISGGCPSGRHDEELRFFGWQGYGKPVATTSQAKAG